PSSFTFGAAGDMGVGSGATATLAQLGTAGTDFFLHLGDFSYGGTALGFGNTPADWCKFVQTKANLPANYPYELVSGGHVSQAASGQDGPLQSYTACLPDQMHSTIAPGSEYGKDYYFDYPATAPLARVFMLAAGETFANGGTPDSYATGSANYAWLSAAIDDARAHNVPWVFVGMAFDCVTAGVKHCEIGADLFNLLTAKKVDLVLQGHEHGYERSGQFALNPASCPGIPISGPTGTPSYSAACMADNGATGTYTKGVGPVVVIAGTAGIGLRPMNQPGTPDAPEAPYFAKLMGGTDHTANHGFMKYTVTATQLTASFVSANDGSAPFTDGFTITGDGAAPPPGSAPSLSPPQTPPASTTAAGGNGAGSGYWMLGAGGHVYPFGNAADHGTAEGTLTPGTRAVHLEPTPSGNGYWIADSTGSVTTGGDARYFGRASALTAGEAVTSLSATPSGNGYWLFTNRGRVFPFGDAAGFGDMTNTKLNGPVLGSIATPSGKGYYMVASDGGIFAFGDAAFHGSMGALHLNAPVQSLVPTPDGGGYWLVASDGGIFAFGDAPFKGSMGGKPLNKAVIGMVGYADGYLMVGSDGGIFDFSSKPFLGSLGAHPPAHPIVSVAAVDSVTQVAV
ncbi:MAG TPA: metallophosphoesterase, partial [Acidimicrobiia bacterium]|nr:metallophosphoesterase [Acidimicrobiia bacterium]